MKQIAVLIPTYKRPHKLAGLIENIKQTSTEAEIYFIITPDDAGTQKTLTELGQKFWVVDGEYGKAINEGYRLTSEPFIFCGSDDIEFTPGWDKQLLGSIQGYQITGGVDDWVVSQSGVHISHPLIRREYVENEGTVLGYRGLIYNPDKFHYHIDVEIEQLAWHRGVIKVNRDCKILHHHFINNQAERDETYQHSVVNLAHDTEAYERFKKYEYWDVTSMFQGRAVENPNKIKRLSVVMPMWNSADYARQTLGSLLNMTANPYELILIDDKSTEYDGKTFLEELAGIARQKFIRVKTIANDQQLYCNANWNRGVKEATGDYIAIINADIDFNTPDWDKYLIEGIDAGNDIANPYQADRVHGQPYMKPSPEDLIYHLNIRGACFMLRGNFARQIFPIPPQLVHWCGDNFISWHKPKYVYDNRAVIFHHISKSGEKLNPIAYWELVAKDVDEWINMTGDQDMLPIKAMCETNLNQARGR